MTLSVAQLLLAGALFAGASPTPPVPTHGGVPANAAMIDAYVRRIGLDPRDNNWLRTPHAQRDHAGGIARLQRITGEDFLMTRDVTFRAAGVEPLPSWNDGAAKRAILDFVDRVSREGSPDYLPPGERVAVFDNDGTLWGEQPMYVQAFFIFDRVRILAPQHPEWRDREPFASVLKGDVAGALAGGERALAEMVMATHAGMTTDEFAAMVSEWITTARHPTTGRLFTDMVYQPMLELLAFLRASGFKTFIVSGGGIEFMRPWAERVYGIPPEQVIGSSITTRYEVRDGTPVLVRLPELHFVDDKAGKPVGINAHIGRRPTAAFGNSDGDLEMLQWTASGPGPRFALYVHHTDARREWAYDRASSVGRLDKGLDAARTHGWTVLDMARDWKVVFPAASR